MPDCGSGAFAWSSSLLFDSHPGHLQAETPLNTLCKFAEIGHALGLGHTSNSNAGTAGAVYPNDALWSNDGGARSDFAVGEPQTLDVDTKARSSAAIWATIR